MENVKKKQPAGLLPVRSGDKAVPSQLPSRESFIPRDRPLPATVACAACLPTNLVRLPRTPISHRGPPPRNPICRRRRVAAHQQNQRGDSDGIQAAAGQSDEMSHATFLSAKERTERKDFTLSASNREKAGVRCRKLFEPLPAAAQRGGDWLDQPDLQPGPLRIPIPNRDCHEPPPEKRRLKPETTENRTATISPTPKSSFRRFP
jgi:hypothetical protein